MKQTTNLGNLVLDTHTTVTVTVVPLVTYRVGLTVVCWSGPGCVCDCPGQSPRTPLRSGLSPMTAEGGSFGSGGSWQLSRDPGTFLLRQRRAVNVKCRTDTCLRLRQCGKYEEMTGEH